ncbi:hypothetical protein [Psychrosphaera algicola]|uniref:Uncharacterized protein n=1 Tax=Psychrosphaera algicola TaxID=3023714 RepID=A0ABT5FIM6_9GAMM|nr:hypothetical protein [Psychrosphaera sp. G1-22]MDC2891060.1 hypothetical protein [Psychrosphaera sp. G1-22]
MKTLWLIAIPLFLFGCSSDSKPDQETDIDSDNDGVVDSLDPFPHNPELSAYAYLAENGITIVAVDEASVGKTQLINGVEYTIVDDKTIRDYDKADLHTVITTKVTNLKWMFINAQYVPDITS